MDLLRGLIFYTTSNLNVDKQIILSIVKSIMNLETFFEATLIMSRAALIIYLLLAVILGWAIKSVLRKKWWHRFWEHGIHPQHTAQQLYVNNRRSYLGHSEKAFTRSRMQPIPMGNYAAYQPHNSAQNLETKTVDAHTQDLTIIEGIGPRIQEILNQAGIRNWYDLSQSPASKVREILEHAEGQFTMHDPTTWPHQAQLAQQGRWDELKKYQDFLVGGRA